MNIDYIVIALIIILILVMLFNRKVNVAKVFVEQVSVFRDNRTKKLLFGDMLSHVICPILLSLIMVVWYEFRIVNELAQSLTTAFSLVFTLLLAFETILVGKKNSANGIEREVISQTFVSTVCASIFALTGIILSITVSFVSNCTAIAILTILLLSLSLMMVMLLLMIIKRIFKVFMHDNENNDK